MPNLAEIQAAEADWVRRYNLERSEAVELRNHIHRKFVEYLECTPEELLIEDVDEAVYDQVADQLDFCPREKLIRDSNGIWFAHMILKAGLAEIFLRIDFKESEGNFYIRDAAFDAEALGSSDNREAIIETFFARLSTRLVETTRLPTWQKNIKERSFRGFNP